jgi:cytochrome b
MAAPGDRAPNERKNMMHKMVIAGTAGATKRSFRPPAWTPLLPPLFWGVLAAFLAIVLAGEKFAWLTGGAAYGVAVLAILRIVWAFVGPRHGAFAEALRAPQRLVVKARQSLRRRAPLFPSGLLTDRTTAAAVVGLLTYVSVAGMFASASHLSGSHAFLAAHDAGLLALVGLVFLRLAGAVLTGVASGERLVQAALKRGRRC